LELQRLKYLWKDTWKVKKVKAMFLVQEIKISTFSFKDCNPVNLILMSLLPLVKQRWIPRNFPTLQNGKRWSCRIQTKNNKVGPALDHPGIRRQDTSLWCGAVDNALWSYLTSPIISSLTIFWLRKIAVFFYCIFISGPESEDVIWKCNLRYCSNFSIISSRLVFKMWNEVSGQKISEKLMSRAHLTV